MAADCAVGAGRRREGEPLGATQRRQSGQKEKSLVFESGEQEKTGALIGGCQGDGPWGLLNFFSVLPPELRAAIECMPGLKAEGSGVDPGLGESQGQGDRDATTRLPPAPPRPAPLRRAYHPRTWAWQSNKHLVAERLLNPAGLRVLSTEPQLQALCLAVQGKHFYNHCSRRCTEKFF